jgi:hypothetical protein
VQNVGNQFAVSAPATNHFAPVIQASGSTPLQNADAADKIKKRMRDLSTVFFNDYAVKQMRHGIFAHLTKGILRSIAACKI